MRFIDGLDITDNGYDIMEAKYPTDIFRLICANNGFTLNDIIIKTGWDQKTVSDALEYLSNQKLIRMSISTFGDVRFYPRIANSQMSILDW